MIKGSLVLTIEFDLERGAWVVGLSSPVLWDLGQTWTTDRVYSQILIPLAVFENEDIGEYLDTLLKLHFERLALPHGALPIWRPIID